MLSWDDPNNDPSVVTGYNLYYWESGASSNKVNVGLQTSYTVRGMTDGKTYSFAVTAYDDRGNESSQSAVISETIGNNINNTTPVANNGTLTVAANSIVTGKLSGSDADGDPLTYHLATAARLGVVNITDANTGAYTYTPGAPTVELPVASVRASSDDGNVPANTLDNDLATRWSASGDGQWIEYDLGSTQTVTGMAIAWYVGDQRVSFFEIGVSGDGSNWTTVFNGQSSGTTLDPEKISFSPVQARYVRYIGHMNSASGWNSLTEVDVYTSGSPISGTDAFTFTVNDGKVSSSEATVTVTITSVNVNSAPVASNGSLSTPEDVAASGKLMASDANGDALTFKLSSNGSKGTAVITNSSTGAYTYTPQANATGSDSFTFTAYDGTVTSNLATVTVTISPVNDAPVASNGSLSTSEDVVASGKLSASDPDGDALTFKITSNGSKGTAAITNSNTGAYTYTPQANATGSDSFTFTAYDGTVSSNTATVTVTIKAVNDNPVAVSDAVQTDEDKGINIAVLANDSDPDGDTLTVASVTQGAHGVVTQGGSGVSYTPNDNFHGSDSFAYTVSDGHGGTATASVTVTVVSVNDAPVATNGTLTTSANTKVSGTLSASDVDGDTLTYHLVTQGSMGTAVMDDAKSGAFTYTPNVDATGNESTVTDTLTFVANDGTVDSNSATISVTIRAINDAIVLEVGEVSVDNAWKQVALTKNFTDPVVVAKPMGHNETDPAVVRIRNVTQDGFEIRVQEWGYLDGQHAAEDVGYIVVERGSYTLPDGTQVEANYVDMSAMTPTGGPAVELPVASVRASSDDGNVPANTLDNDLATRWSAEGDGQWIEYDLGSMQTVTGMSIAWYVGDQRVAYFDLAVSGDGSNWTTVFNGQSSGTTLDPEMISFSPVQARFVRYIGHMNSVSAWNSVTEVDVYTSASSSTNISGAIGFQQPFEVAPVVLAAITSVNEMDAVTTRVQNVTPQGFEAYMQEQELNAQAHAAEKMAYVAWSPSSGTLDGLNFEVARTEAVVNQTFYTIQYATTFINLPVFIGDMQTTNSTDTADLRWENMDFLGIDIRVDEEQSGDPEIDHAAEAVGYMAFASNDTSVNADADGDGLSNKEELETYGTDPAVADTDHDGVLDGDEVAFWNAYRPGSWNEDLDHDGMPNLLDFDSDDDGIMDGDEIKQGSDPADPNSPNGPEEIVLSVSARWSRSGKYANLSWSGATGSQVRVFRSRNGSPDGNFTTDNDGAARDNLGRRGSYSYQLCETDGSFCSPVVAASY